MKRITFFIILFCVSIQFSHSQTLQKFVFFDTGKHQLRAEAKATLDSLTDRLSHLTDYQIGIAGHTDNRADKAYNEALSERRSNSVKNYLRSKGIAAERFLVSSFGETKPLSNNSDERGRQLNRRVSITVISNELIGTRNVFQFSASQDTVLLGIDGTMLFINANSFADADGFPYEGEIKIHMTEYYNMSDIILAGLSTTSNGELLETGGMLNITATGSDQQQLDLISGERMSVYFPFEQNTGDMKAFYGEWHNEEMNWLEDPSVDSKFTKVSMYWTESPPTFNYDKFYFDKPKIAWNRWQRLMILMGVNNKKYQDLERRVYERERAKQLAKWKQKRDTRYAYYLEQKKIWDNDSLSRSERKAKFEALRKKYLEIERQMADKYLKDNYVDENGELSGITAAELQDHILNVSQLGWINCDRFYSSEQPRVAFAVKSNEKHDEDCLVQVVFRDIRSVVSASRIDDKFVFSDIPQGMKATVIAIKTEEDTPYLAMQEIEVEPDVTLDLAFEKTDYSGLKNVLNSLSTN